MKVKALKSFCGTVTMGIGDVKDVEEKMALGLIGAGYAQLVEEKATAGKQSEAAPEGTIDSEVEAAEQPQAEPAKKTSKKAKS